MATRKAKAAAVRTPQVKGVAAGTQARTAATIRAGLKQGKSVGTIARRLERRNKGWKRKEVGKQSRAYTIAQTEVTAATNRAAVAEGMEKGARRFLVHDGVEDTECARANGKVWNADYAAANPISHPNCTREFEPVYRKGRK